MSQARHSKGNTMKKTILAAALALSGIGAAQALTTQQAYDITQAAGAAGANAAPPATGIGVGSEINAPQCGTVVIGGTPEGIGGTGPTTTPTAAAPGVAGPDVRALGFAGRGIAELSALQAPTTFGPNGLGVAVGVGSYAGYGAIGASVAQQFHIDGRPAAFSIGGAMSGSGAQPVLHAGFSMGF
uniref:Trimeric autotransporter adhesin YadA-like C-terminal membrane anchor domain-containing protein n=1 Tax=Thiomonas intermedia (strain K12) TaxID=75379 RepID=D5X4J7_THIK1